MILPTFLNSLELAEKELDKSVLRLRLLVEESHCQRIKCNKRLRIFIDQKDDKNLIVHGRVLNDYKNFGELRTSDLVNRFALFNNNKWAEWIKTEDCSPIDSFVIPIETNKIMFDFVNPRELVEMNLKLGNLVNKKTNTRTGILVDLWEYSRSKKIVHKSQIKCDQALFEIFEKDFISLDDPNLLDNLVKQPSPLFIDVKNGSVYDVEFDLDDLVDFPVLYGNKKIHSLTRKMENLCVLLRGCKEKFDILNEFSHDPVKFIEKNCISDERRMFYDLKVQEKIINLIEKKE